ncbi:proline-rich receptor-like protein kinase PERK15 [Prunus avium]|uniref:non-specific serine/threonine protein kinase n=1 Tax=Prunus avium TaxID=42229 RepID=A0A6P5SYX3_PRUAV|nr:proline-rich receptor-like protein kinase PERK15 [Prunus avium]
MSSPPPWSLPPAASPVTTPPLPLPLQPSLPLPLSPSLPPPLPPLLPPPLPQITPFPSPPFLPTTPPALPPIPNSAPPPVSSPLLPPLTSPPPQLPPLPALLPPTTFTPPPPPPSVVTSPPPPSSPPKTPLPSKPSLPPPPNPPSPLPTPTPTPLHVSPPTTPSTPPPPPTLATTMPPATQTPPLASPSHGSPPPALPPSTLQLPPTLASTLQPPSSNKTNTTNPPPKTLPMPPQLMLHPPLSSSLPATLQVHNPRPNMSTALIAGSCVIGGLVAIVLLLAIIFLGYKRRRSKNNSALLEDHHKTPSFCPKDDCYAVPSPGVHVIRVLSRTSVPQSPMSRTASSASIISRSEIPYPPQTQRPAGFPSYVSNGIFTYDQLVVATNGFSEANLLGQGGFGYVHKGVLPSGKEVAVKQLMTGSRQGEREFQAEVDIISRVHHKHLVSLVGYCITGAERLLVYEFVPNNTLEFHLHGNQVHAGEGQSVLEWETRLIIATGSAKGLAYLHEDCNPKIIHRDIKASNILLDDKFEAKVSDFGLAKSFSDTNIHMTNFSTRVVGTFGYLAPEYASSGKVTDKSDVYSYGVVLLELITGRPPISTIESMRNEGLVQWARPLLTQALEDGDFDALVDPRLERNYNNNEMARMVACAAACVRHSAWLRPRMSQVVHALEGVASLTDLREGMTPGNSTLHNSLGNSYYSSQQYKEEYGISMYSGTTSEYGLNPSGSSSEAKQTF